MTARNTSYRIIRLTKGQVTKVDASDYDWLSQWKWMAMWNPNTNSFYAKRNATVGELQKGYPTNVMMHRFIAGVPVKAGRRIQVDHENHDTLDNQRSNLRCVNPSQSGMNRTMRSDNKSGYKGVHWHSQCDKWVAGIVFTKDGKRHHISLGLYEDPKEAHAAYCEAAKKYHGEFARFQ